MLFPCALFSWGLWATQKLLFHTHPLTAPPGSEACLSLLEMRGPQCRKGPFSSSDGIGMVYKQRHGVRWRQWHGDSAEQLGLSWRCVYFSRKVKCWLFLVKKAEWEGESFEGPECSNHWLWKVSCVFCVPCELETPVASACGVAVTALCIPVIEQNGEAC